MKHRQGGDRLVEAGDREVRPPAAQPGDALRSHHLEFVVPTRQHRPRNEDTGGATPKRSLRRGYCPNDVRSRLSGASAGASVDRVRSGLAAGGRRIRTRGPALRRPSPRRAHRFPRRSAGESGTAGGTKVRIRFLQWRGIFMLGVRVRSPIRGRRLSAPASKVV